MATHKIHTADLNEIARIVTCLPQWATQPTQTMYYAATSSESGQLLGGAAIRFDAHGSNQLVAVFEEFVETDEELGEGPAVMLIQAMKVVARKKQANALRYGGPVWHDSSLEKCLLQCHFLQQGEDVTHYRLPPLGDPLWQRFSRFCKTLEKRKKVDSNLSLVPLNKVSVTPVAELIRRTIGSAGSDLNHEALHPETVSMVVLEKTVVRGVHLVTVDGNRAHSAALAIDLKARNSWVYSALIAEVHRRLVDKGVTEWTFKTNPGIHRGVENLGKRMNADVTGIERTYLFPIVEH